MTTIFSACMRATNHIWDDRMGYIKAVLETLRIDPEADYEQYLYDGALAREEA